MISSQAQLLPTPPRTPGAAMLMDDAAFMHWVRLLEQWTGVVVPPSRRQFLETNLKLRLKELEYTDLQRYHDERLVGPSGAREWAVLVDRLTVHETRFFRHPPSLALVREVVLPTFAERSHSGRDFHAWSVGCSTGEEAYSLAMVIDDFAGRASPRFRYGVTGSDVSGPALKVAAASVYPEQRRSEVPDHYRRYLHARSTDEFSIDREIRSRTRFAQLNMLEIDRQPMTGLELIYCQNVLIYFPRPRRAEYLDRLVACLRPGGCLIIGPGEVTRWNNPDVDRIEHKRALAFRRRSQSGRSAKDSPS